MLADEIANDKAYIGAEHEGVICDLLDNGLVYDFEDLGKVYKDADGKTFETDALNARLIYFANELREMADMIESL